MTSRIAARPALRRMFKTAANTSSATPAITERCAVPGDLLISDVLLGLGGWISLPRLERIIGILSGPDLTGRHLAGSPLRFPSPLGHGLPRLCWEPCDASMLRAPPPGQGPDGPAVCVAAKTRDHPLLMTITDRGVTNDSVAIVASILHTTFTMNLHIATASLRTDAEGFVYQLMRLADSTEASVAGGSRCHESMGTGAATMDGTSHAPLVPGGQT